LRDSIKKAAADLWWVGGCFYCQIILHSLDRLGRDYAASWSNGNSSQRTKVRTSRCWICPCSTP